jgi:hypothetical protein
MRGNYLGYLNNATKAAGKGARPYNYREKEFRSQELQEFRRSGSRGSPVGYGPGGLISVSELFITE